MESPRTFTYKSVDDLKIDLDVWLPSDGPDEGSSSQGAVKATPAVVWIHGGGGFRGNKSLEKSPRWFPFWMKDVVVKHNKWIFISANYRLLVPTNGHHILEDIKDVFTYISQELVHVDFDTGGGSIKIDPARLAVGGESFGGYCAKLAGLYVEPKPRAVITFFGMGGNFLTPFNVNGRHEGGPYPVPFHDSLFPDVSKVYKSTEVLTGTDEAIKDHNDPPRDTMFRYSMQQGLLLDYLTGQEGLSALIKERLESKEEVDWNKLPEMKDSRCLFPELNLTSKFPPTFMTHGTADTAVLVDESRYLSKQLTELGVENVLIEVEGGEHGFDLGVKAEDGDELYEKLKGIGPWLWEKLQ